jgi:hypothetical protein
VSHLVHLSSKKMDDAPRALPMADRICHVCDKIFRSPYILKRHFLTKTHNTKKVNLKKLTEKKLTEKSEIMVPIRLLLDGDM